MIESEAIVETTNASRYLQQLCKHFRHKIVVEFDAEQAQATFPWGYCRMNADADRLLLRCGAEDEERLGRIQYVLDDHLTRFAHRETPQIDWRRIDG